MTRTTWFVGLFSFASLVPCALSACGDGTAVTTDGGKTTSAATGEQTSSGSTGGGGSGGASTGGTGGSVGGAGGAGGTTSVGGTGSGGNTGGSGGVGGVPSGDTFDKVLGSVADDSARGVAVDGGGNAVVVGSYNGSLDIDGTVLASTLTDIFVARVDTTGKLVWTKSFGTTKDDRGVGVAVNPQGQILVAGSFGDVGGHWGGEPYQGSGPLFAKLAPDGTNLWTKPWGLNGSGNWGGIAADPDGTAWVTGVFNGTINFGGGNLASSGTSDPFIAHLDVNGGTVTLTTFAGDVTLRAPAPDGQGGLFISGTFKGTLDLGAGPMMTAVAMTAESFVARIAPNGMATWSKKLPGIVQRTAADPAGNMLVTGYFGGTVDFGTGMLVSAGSDDIFVLKLAGDGTPVWAKKLGATSADAGRALSADAAGNVYVSGFFSGAPDFGMGPLVVGLQRNALVVKLGPDGQVLGARGFGGDGNEEGLHVAVDSLGSAFVWGELDAPGNYGSGVKAPVGLKDVFLVKVAP